MKLIKMANSKKNSSKRIMIIMGVILTFVVFFSINGIAYYTNLGKWLDQQTNSYVDGEGQQRLLEDFIEDGCGSDTMLDTVTGLCWDKNLNRNGSTLQWALNNAYPEPLWSGAGYTWPAGRVDTDYPAFKACNDLMVGGNTDWRMPTRAELLTLIDEIGVSGTTCTTLTSFGFTNCQNSFYWSSNQRGSSTSYTFNVNLNGGNSAAYAKTDIYYVACVRRN